MGTVVMRRIDQAQFLSRIIPPLAVPEQKDILPFSLCRQFRQRLREMPGDGLAVAIEKSVSPSHTNTPLCGAGSGPRWSVLGGPPCTRHDATAITISNEVKSGFISKNFICCCLLQS